MAAHPAQFSDQLLAPIERMIEQFAVDGQVDVVDPFAGPGIKLHDLCNRRSWGFYGMDIEEWEGRVPGVEVGDATDDDCWRNLLEGLDNPVIVTSPTYGNGLNDHHEPKEDSRRFTYRVALGEALHENNSGRYGIRQGRKAWHEYWRINSTAMIYPLNEGIPVIVNVKAFIHDGEVVDLPSMWEVLLITLGYHIISHKVVETPGIRFGQNSEARTPGESIITATTW